MSLPTLLTVPTNEYAASTFAFEHRMAHRTLSLSMSPMDRFSVAPYHFDPMLNTGGWKMNHAKAHDDFRVNLPVFFGWWYIGTQEYGVASGQNLQDVNLTNQGQLQIWTFMNHMEHYVAENLLPLARQLGP